MIFEDFVKAGKVIKGEKDIQKAKALIKMSENNFNTSKKIEITEVSSSAVFGIVYESIREIVEAICLLEGLKVYSHEAFTKYLEKIGEHAIAAKFDRLRKLRNGANYYGKSVPVEVTNNAKKQVSDMRIHLIKKYVIYV